MQIQPRSLWLHDTVRRKHEVAHNGTTAPLCVVTVVVPLYTG